MGAQAVAGDVWMLETNNLSPEYFDMMVKGVSGVSADQCTGLVHDIIDPRHMVMIVVGDANAIKKDLEKVGPVEVIKTGPEFTPPKPAPGEKPEADKDDDEDKDGAEKKDGGGN